MEKMARKKFVYLAVLIVGLLAGCEGLQLNLPVTTVNSEPTTKRDFWVYLNDNPSDYNQGGSLGWDHYPVCVGCTMVLSAWYKENNAFKPTRFSRSEFLNADDQRLVGITKIGDGHKVLVRGLTRGKIRDITFYDVDGNHMEISDIVVR